MLQLATTLSYYKRPDVQERILEGARNREVWIKYGERPGKRPDVLVHGRDVFEAARQGATSFHISVERWYSPLDLAGVSSPGELNEMRAGWDLIIDVDCEYWEVAKQITHLFVQLLNQEGVHSIGVKFSGNKGFHIIVPFEAFPSDYRGKPMEVWYPEVPKRVLKYLHKRLEASFREKVSDNILERTGISLQDLYAQKCRKCGTHTPLPNDTYEFVCSRDETREQDASASAIKQCPKCSSFMKNMGKVKRVVCRKCHSDDFETIIDLPKIIKLDEGLVISRHMIRGAYSLHEKSGLVSLPIHPDAIISFEREQADIANLPAELPQFMPAELIEGEASLLFEHAMDYTLITDTPTVQRRGMPHADFEAPTVALEEQHFPPCMKLTLQGVKDGKKRASFFLLNFLSSVGWSYEQIEKRLDEWNELNNPPLRKGFLQSQIRSHKAQAKKMLPPNCDNQAYYVDIGVCQPDSLCRTIRNPANYAIKRARRVANETKKA